MGKIYVVNWSGFFFRPLVTRGPPFNIDPWAYICRWLAREGKGDIGVVGCGVPKKIPTRPDSFPCNYRPFGQSGRGMGRLGARANVPTSKDSTYPKHHEKVPDRRSGPLSRLRKSRASTILAVEHFTGRR